MSITPDYDYYTEYGGNLSSDEFEALVADAAYTVNFLTLGRSDNPPECMTKRVKDCICAIVDVMHGYSQAAETLPRGIASISNDGYSVTRGAGAGDGAGSTEQDDYIAVCKKYLTLPCNLMYMGVG